MVFDDFSRFYFDLGRRTGVAKTARECRMEKEEQEVMLRRKAKEEQSRHFRSTVKEMGSPYALASTRVPKAWRVDYSIT